jgi:hypothetical protein
MNHIGRICPAFFRAATGFALGFALLPKVASAQSAPVSAAAQPVVAVAASTAPDQSTAGATAAAANGSTVGASIRVSKSPAISTGNSAAGASSSTVKTSTAAVASADKPLLKGLKGTGSVLKLSPSIRRALKDFERASATFPSFCRDWERKLRDREHNNLAHMNWRREEGNETATYVGYSAIDSCVCKQASNGVPIGELTYKEYSYSLTGKSVEDARHSQPKQTSISPTREIFSWDKGKWYY